MKVKHLMKQAIGHYPNSKHLRKQWVRKTIDLISTGKHVLYGGDAKWGHGVQLIGEQK